MINSTAGTRRDFPGAVQFDVRRQVVGKTDGLTIGLALLQGELIGGGINLTEVVDASIGSRCECSGVEIRQENEQENSNQAKRKYPEKNIWLKCRFVF